MVAFQSCSFFWPTLYRGFGWYRRDGERAPFYRGVSLTYLCRVGSCLAWDFGNSIATNCSASVWSEWSFSSKIFFTKKCVLPFSVVREVSSWLPEQVLSVSWRWSVFGRWTCELCGGWWCNIWEWGRKGPSYVPPPWPLPTTFVGCSCIPYVKMGRRGARRAPTRTTTHLKQVKVVGEIPEGPWLFLLTKSSNIPYLKKKNSWVSLSKV